MTDKNWLSNRLAWHSKRSAAHKCTCHACWARRHTESPLDELPRRIRHLFGVTEGGELFRKEDAADSKEERGE